ncbi:MAG: hypothetical protein ACREHD_00140 [Pirellulales bacterium]
MATCETSGSAPLGEIFLTDSQDADQVIELPDGRRVHLEWCGDVPEIDAVLSMDDARDDALRATAPFDS